MIFYGSQTCLESSYPKQSVVTIGNFDGVHLGHAALIHKAQQVAKDSGDCQVVAYTFQPHPTLEFQPESDMKLIMSYEEKNKCLHQMGVDHVVQEKFDASFSSLTAEQFVNDILIERLHAKAIVVGKNFRFGSSREGDVSMLSTLLAKKGASVFVVEPVLYKDQFVSSTLVRSALQQTNLEFAKELLGHNFFYSGEIIHGDKRGRLLGFPTANMKCGLRFALPNGVYVTSLTWQDRSYPSVTNIGTRPTFNASSEIPIRIETHVLDQNFDLYGQHVQVDFYKKLRDELRFSNVEELKRQIADDVLQSKIYFNGQV